MRAPCLAHCPGGLPGGALASSLLWEHTVATTSRTREQLLPPPPLPPWKGEVLPSSPPQLQPGELSLHRLRLPRSFPGVLLTRWHCPCELWVLTLS